MNYSPRRNAMDSQLMALSSMTGFARGQGSAGSYAWAWELKSVNSKGLDLKLRLPPGWEAIEPGVRARASEVLSRGSVFANLTVSREGATPVARINEPALNAVLAALKGPEGSVEILKLAETGRDPEIRAASRGVTPKGIM